jgi:hypothetical protein
VKQATDGYGILELCVQQDNRQSSMGHFDCNDDDDNNNNNNNNTVSLYCVSKHPMAFIYTL